MKKRVIMALNFLSLLKSEIAAVKFVYFRKSIISNLFIFQLNPVSFYSLLVMYVVVIVVGISDNLLVLVAVMWRPSMRTSHNFFIAGLALSDLFLCSFTMPGKLVFMFNL